MWKLVFFLIGVLFAFYGGADVKTTFVGEEVTLACNGTPSTTNPKVAITWSLSNGTPFFHCEQNTIACDKNTTRHSLGGKDDFVSILTIRNVSLIHEDEYIFSMTSRRNQKDCRINLTVNVPPKGLILVDTYHGRGDKVLQNGGLLRVAEGENKTIVCKTNTSVKPTVNLTWVIPGGLDVISEYGKQIKDEHDERLFVSTRTLSFTTNYTSDKDKSLLCKVDTDPSFESINTSVHVISEHDEREITTNSKHLRTSSNGIQTTATSKEDLEGGDASYTTMTTDLAIATADSPIIQNQRFILIIAGVFGVVMILLLAAVAGIIRSRKMAIRRSVKVESIGDVTQDRPSHGRGALPTPPSNQSFLADNHIPDRQPSPTRSFRPAPQIPSDIPMRQMVPVSDDITGTTSENERLRGTTSRGAMASISASHSQRGLDTDMEYDLLNDMEYDVLNMEYAVVDKTPSKAHRAVPHVYRETSDGLAEYALVSRPKMGKNALQPRFRNTEQMDAEFEYAVVDKSHRTGRESVPHVYTQTMSGLEEYAVVNKPKDRKKRQSEVRHTTAPGDFEAEYAVVDKWKKN